jgi:hypothetical protein
MPDSPEELTSDVETVDLPHDPETDDFWFFLIEAKVTGCEAEFYLNGFALTVCSEDKGLELVQPVNQYIIDGENELAFVVKPGPIPSQAESGPPEGKTEAEAYTTGGESVMVRLCRYPYGAVSGGPERQILQELTWPLEIHEETHEYPLRMAVRFPVKTGTGPWLWEGLPEITLDEAARGEIGEFLEGLRASLEKQDPEPFLAAGAPRFDELAKAYEDPPYKKRNILRRTTEEIEGMQALDPETFDLRLAAGGRLVECLAKDWDAILREAPDKDGNVDHYDMFIGRDAGGWKMYR